MRISLLSLGGFTTIRPTIAAISTTQIAVTHHFPRYASAPHRYSHDDIRFLYSSGRTSPREGRSRRLNANN